VLAPSARAIQLKINFLRKYFEDLGLKVNLAKTQVVIFRRGGRIPEESCHFGDKKIETLIGKLGSVRLAPYNCHHVARDGKFV